MSIHFPKQKIVQDTLGKLLGRDVELKRVPPDLGGAFVVAAYANDRNALVAVVATDLSFACGSGAALCLMPAGPAREAIDAGAMDEDLKEPVHEVLNIMAQLFNSAKTAHVRLVRVFHKADGRPPPAVLNMLLEGKKTLSLEATIKGYPGGRILLRTAG